jgi:hypothetical protein
MVRTRNPEHGRGDGFDGQRQRKLERVPDILNQLFGVIAGLVPAFHVPRAPARKMWMAGTSPAMTLERWSISSERALNQCQLNR